jgi:uncharacterized protein YjbI with pentapeptide repeats
MNLTPKLGTTPEEAIRKGAEFWNDWRSSVSVAQIKDGNLDGLDLTDYDLSEIHFAQTSFNNANLGKSNIKATVFNHCRGLGTRFAIFTDTSFVDCNFSELSLPDQCLDLRGANFRDVTIRDTSFKAVYARNFTSTKLIFVKCRFENIEIGSNLAGARFEESTFLKSSFKEVDLRGTTFKETILDNVDLQHALVDDDTSFKGAKLGLVKIDRFTLELMGEGGFSRSQKMRIQITDPVATVRQAFSGIMQYIHLIALLIFLTPYVTFLTKQYEIAAFTPNTWPTITVAKKFWLYLKTGGTYKALSVENLTIVTFLMLYNVNRAVLLWKTKLLEIQQESTGLPTNFSLKGAWGISFKVAKYGFYLNLALVGWHTVHFLLMRVPVPF